MICLYDTLDLERVLPNFLVLMLTRNAPFDEVRDAVLRDPAQAFGRFRRSGLQRAVEAAVGVSLQPLETDWPIGGREGYYVTKKGKELRYRWVQLR